MMEDEVHVPLNGWEIVLSKDGPESWFWLYDESDRTPVLCWVAEGTEWENMSVGAPCEAREIPPDVREKFFAILRCFNWNQCQCCGARFEPDQGGVGEICSVCGWEYDILEVVDGEFYSSANHTTLERYTENYQETVWAAQQERIIANARRRIDRLNQA